MSLICTTFSLVLGLYFLRNNLFISIVISLVYLIFIFFRFNKKIFAICLLLFATGITITSLNLEYNSKNNIYSGFVVEAKDNYFLFKSKTETFYVYEQDNLREIGDYLVIESEPSKLKINTFESQFNFKNYLNNKGIKRELQNNVIDVKFNSFLKIHKFKTSFLRKFDENTAPLIEAFLFNEKDYSSNAIKITSELQITSLFSLSGIYLHFIFAALTYLFSLKFSDKISEMLPFIILLPYSFFSLTKVGTIRVFSLYLLKLINKHKLKNKFSHVELVSILALIFITLNYHLVYQEAFYIGFLLSVGIPFIINAFKFVNKKKTKLLVFMVIQSLFIPIQIVNGYFDPFLILITAIFIIPNLIFISFTMLSLFIPYYSLINKLGGVLNWILEKISIVKITIPISDLGGAFAFLFYLLLLLGVYFLEANRIKHFKIAICGIITVILIAIVPIQDPIINGVYFINVGQGDSILIKNKNHTVLIDTGGQKNVDLATETLIPFFNKNKITHIDALITTHDDFDHNGAADSLMKNFRTYHYLKNKTDFPYKVGDIYLENINNKLSSDDNDKSLVLYMKFMNKKWLFMGDASIEIEKYIIEQNLNVNCDILKIGHHGSKTSTCEEFIKYVTPNTAIISVGSKNYYGHPNYEVINLLNKYNVKIRRTDEEGTISYLSLIA